MSVGLANAAGDVYTLLLENDRVRVFDVRFRPGQKAVMHRHPDHVVYVLAHFAANMTVPGESGQVIPLKAGQAVWIGAGPHEVQNIGTTEGHALVVELKEGRKN